MCLLGFPQSPPPFLTSLSSSSLFHADFKLPSSPLYLAPMCTTYVVSTLPSHLPLFLRFIVVATLGDVPCVQVGPWEDSHLFSVSFSLYLFCFHLPFSPSFFFYSLFLFSSFLLFFFSFLFSFYLFFLLLFLSFLFFFTLYPLLMRLSGACTGIYIQTLNDHHNCARLKEKK